MWSSEKGMTPLGLLALIIVIIIILLFIGEAWMLEESCVTGDIVECALDMFLPAKKEEPPKGAVTATGVIAGKYAGENRSVTVTMAFPLEGGAVSGSFSGDCDGSIKGSYAGGNGGAISGSGAGSCAFVIPASGTFSGTVNQTSKTVSVSGKGKAAGFSGEGSLTLTY